LHQKIVVLDCILNYKVNFMFSNSISSKLSVAIGIIIASILIAFITLVSIKTRHEAIESAERTAISESRECAEHIQLELSKAIIANRMLCQTFNSVKDNHPDDLSREGVNTILKNTLETFPDLFGAFTVWEPNAFDNNDAKYTNSDKQKAGHDTTGRLIPLWYRSVDGEIKLVPLKDYENEQSSAWYYMPQKTGIETIMDPFYYKNIYMISVINPIMKDGRFLGITGLGMRISFVQKMLDEFDIYDKKGEITILSDAGTIVASSNNPKLAGKPIVSNYKIPATLFTDQKEVISLHNDTLQAFVPFKLGNSEKIWVAMVQIPNSELMASSTSLILILILVGILTIVVLVFGINSFVIKFTKPLLALSSNAEKIALGSIAVENNIETNSIETEKLQSSLDKIVKAEKEISSICNSISENDLTKKAVLRSPEDELSISVNKIVDKLQLVSIEDKKRSVKTTELLEQTKKQTEIMKAHEEELLKKIELLKTKQEELKKTHEIELGKTLEQHDAKHEKVLKSYEQKVTKNLEELQFAKVELQSTKVDMARKETAYLAEIEKLKLGIQKEVLVKTSAFSKFVIPVEVKK
jgi:methyl-accepting chemotaxis protein